MDRRYNVRVELSYSEYIWNSEGGLLEEMGSGARVIQGLSEQEKMQCQSVGLGLRLTGSITSGLDANNLG